MTTHIFWLRVYGRDAEMHRKTIISFGDETCGRTRPPVCLFYVLRGNNGLSVTLENMSAPFL
jgi:hypothetical protein